MLNNVDIEPNWFSLINSVEFHVKMATVFLLHSYYELNCFTFKGLPFIIMTFSNTVWLPRCWLHCTIFALPVKTFDTCWISDGIDDTTRPFSSWDFRLLFDWSIKIGISLVQFLNEKNFMNFLPWRITERQKLGRKLIILHQKRALVRLALENLKLSRAFQHLLQ